MRLGVNIDHIATVRNARGVDYPDPSRSIKIIKEAGADGVTAHLREDRRHMIDSDIEKISRNPFLPLNLEIAATDEMKEITLKLKPNAVCIVPEKRTERTTEGGLDVKKNEIYLANFIKSVKKSGCRVSLFIEPEKKQIEISKIIGADIVEIHTGSYCNYYIENKYDKTQESLYKIKEASFYANQIGLEVHAGHGLTYETLDEIAMIKEIMELNIGHYLISEAIFIGIYEAVKNMKNKIKDLRESFDKKV
tara:strand:- start:1226 stop:1975 length:750 start_codon:yes stop_codon:yes gene_type:complete